MIGANTPNPDESRLGGGISGLAAGFALVNLVLLLLSGFAAAVVVEEALEEEMLAACDDCFLAMSSSR